MSVEPLQILDRQILEQLFYILKETEEIKLRNLEENMIFVGDGGICLVSFCFCCFETGSHYVPLAGLQLIETTLIPNS